METYKKKNKTGEISLKSEAERKWGPYIKYMEFEIQSLKSMLDMHRYVFLLENQIYILSQRIYKANIYISKVFFSLRTNTSLYSFK